MLPNQEVSRDVQRRRFSHPIVFPLPVQGLAEDNDFEASRIDFFEMLGLTARNSHHLSLFFYLYHVFFHENDGPQTLTGTPRGGILNYNGFIDNRGVWVWAYRRMLPHGVAGLIEVDHWWMSFLMPGDSIRTQQP